MTAAMTGDTTRTFVVSSDCMNCGVCEFMCPPRAIVQAPKHFVIEPDLCNGCGLCVPYCLVHAIVPREDLAARQQQTAKARLNRVLRGAAPPAEP